MTGELSAWAKHCLRRAAAREEIESLDRVIYARKFSRPLLGHFVGQAALIYGVPAALIMGRNQRECVSLARAHAMYHAYTEGRDLTLSDIGRRMDGRDHSTVIHLIRRHAFRHGLANPCPMKSAARRARLGPYVGPEPTVDAPYEPKWTARKPRRLAA